MMCLSQTTGYAIRALSCLKDANCAPRLIRDVAKCSGVSKPYLAKVVNLLVRHGLVVAKRGCRGGIVLARPADQITLLEIVKAVEGEQWIGRCFLGIEECEGNWRCPTYAVWRQITKQLETVLGTSTLGDVVMAMKSEGLRRADAPDCLTDSRAVPGLSGGTPEDAVVLTRTP